MEPSEDLSSTQDDPFGLARFVEAQTSVYDRVVLELGAGYKRTHWMWFIFPQIEGLGQSATARRYAIKSLEEAHAYLDHPLLGSRLSECTELVLHQQGRSMQEIFGSPDDMKFRSSMTLFECAAGADSEFSGALEKYFSGERDARTLALLRDK